MKELLEGFLSRLETESKPKEGEYLGEDGLLYCGNCHTPVPEGIPWEHADTSLHLQMQAGGDAPAEGRG